MQHRIGSRGGDGATGGIFPAESKAWFCFNRAAPAPRALRGGVQIRARLLHGRLAERGSVQLLGS